MEISSPKDKQPTAEELQELERIKVIIERATKDGKLTGEEFAVIKDAIRADKKITFEELQLVRKLIYEKIERGELERVWD